MTIPILRTPQLRAIEARHAQAAPPLMERAGEAAAMAAEAMLPPHAGVLVVAGPGNNGGDAFVVARRLKQAGHAPVVLFAGDASRLPPDARAALSAWQEAGGTTHAEFPAGPFALAVDGLFGIGLKRPLEGRHAELVARINSLGCPVLALDAPSGLDGETGRVMGIAVNATRTVTFMAWKPGLLTLDGPDQCGEITVADLGLDWPETDGVVNEVALFRDRLKPRAKNSHKGSYGSVAIIGGAPGMAGAALLAGRAALKLGAGRVYVGMLEPMAVDPMQPELMLRAPDAVFEPASALAIGPGLGASRAAADLLRRALDSSLPAVIDADGLNLLARHPVLMKRVARRTAPTVLTPHPAEAARLLGTTTDAVQADRVAAALALASRCHADVVLKGCGSVIAAADGQWAINTSGNAGLATAGSGDVLTGFVATLLAQGWPGTAALRAAVHLHGAAADARLAANSGPIGMTAGEVIDEARRLFNAWVAANA